MSVRSGRLEKRIRLAVPVQISGVLEPSASERTITENVCSLGIRIVTHRAWESNEPLIVSSSAGDLRSIARVVYCERLPNGSFAVGLQFEGVRMKWPKDSTTSSSS